MKRVWLYFAAVAIIAANLLLPERLVSYRSCCYDERGNIASCACEITVVPGAIIHGDCCDPIVHQLRSAPAPAVVHAKIATDVPASDALPAPVPALLPLDSDQISTAVVELDTGPPGPVDLLPLHCRLNV